MPNNVLFIVIALLVAGFALVIWSCRAKGKPGHPLPRTVGVPYRNVTALLLGLIAALLPLTSQTWSISTAIWIFVSMLLLTMFLLIVLRPSGETKPDLFSWQLLVIVVLGFGLGALLYQARSWWIWLWNKYRLINEPHELLLEALFLLGVILGVFVVRNWGKEDKDFRDSLTGVLGGTFIAAVLGEVQEGLTPMRALAYYTLGFTMSGAINLLLAARLTAQYTNKQSNASRALLDFLYGSQRTKIIDSYFLKNFEEDPDYAKRFLRNTLLEYRNLARREFAEAMQRKMESRVQRPPDTDAHCVSLKELEDAAKQLRQEIKSYPTKLTAAEAADKQTKEDDLANVTLAIRMRESKFKPTYFYELFAIECGPKTAAPSSPSSVNEMDREYSVVYKRLDDETSPILESMFRVGVAMRRQDVLEYIVAPGQYQASFPYIGSVAGLSLIVRQTIIMDRDRNKKFRSKDYRDGICPRDIEQWRGLDEIDFLSYISIPVVSRLGHSTENPLGVVNIDTKIFVTHCELGGQPVEGTPGMFRKQLTPNQLNEYAANLYDQEDKDVDYIEKLTKIIEPVLELYAKCCVGAT